LVLGTVYRNFSIDLEPNDPMIIFPLTLSDCRMSYDTCSVVIPLLERMKNLLWN
jgi:hypothetical protein